MHPEATATGSTSLTGFGFSEYRVVSTLRQPRAIGLNADLALTAAIEQGIRSTFNFARKGVNAEIARRLSPGVRTNARYSFNTTRTFQSGPITPENQARIDRLFPQVRLSVFAGAISRDTRDDVLDPERGTFISEEASVASRALGGQVGFLKSYMQGFWFHRLPVHKRVVFASRVAIGLADGFPRTVASIDGIPQPPIEDLPASERFFAGGDTTIRGFALDTAGAPNTISPTGFPKGGNALLLLNGELRVPVGASLARRCSWTAATSSTGSRKLNSTRFASPPVSACVTARRLARFASTSGSSSIVRSLPAVSNQGMRSTSASARLSEWVR